MKIYRREPQHVLRIQITEQGQETQYMSVIECQQAEFLEFAKRVIRNHVTMIGNGKVTNVQVREGLGGDNGKSVSFSFRGLHPEQVKEILTNSITKKPRK